MVICAAAGHIRESSRRLCVLRRRLQLRQIQLHQNDDASKMNTAFKATTFPRRDLLKAGGALIIGFSWRGPLLAQGMDAVGFIVGPDQTDPNRLDTWVAVHADKTATHLFIGC